MNGANNLEKLGYGRDSTAQVLGDLCRLRFVHTVAQGDAALSTSFYPSRLGGYVIRSLIADATFLEAVLMDTFIPDPEIWNKLREVSEQIDAQRGDIVGRLKLRQDRIRVYFDYTHSMYEEILIEARRRALAAEWISDPFESGRRLLDRNLRRAMKSANQNYGRESNRAVTPT